MDSTRVRSSFAFTSIPTIAYFPTTTAVASFTPGTLAAKDAKWSAAFHLAYLTYLYN